MYNMSLNIFIDPLANLFGWITRIFYSYFGSYGLSIIALTTLIRICLIPLSLSSQRSMLKTQAMSQELAEIQRRCGNDKERYNREAMALQQKYGVGAGFGGCLLSVLQIFFIWPIYRIVSRPLFYIANVSTDSIKAMAELAGLKPDMINANNISLIHKLTSNSEVLSKSLERGLIKMSQLINFDFFGMDLTLTPSINPSTILSKPSTYLPMLVIAILVVGTQVFSMQLTNWLKPGYKEEKLAKERAKKNQAMPTEVNPAEQYMKMMTYGFPIIMLVTTFTLPAAFAIYWVMNGILGIGQQFLIYYLFSKPYELKKKELAEKKAQAFKKKKEENKDNTSNKSSSKSKKKKTTDNI